MFLIPLIASPNTSNCRLIIIVTLVVLLFLAYIAQCTGTIAFKFSHSFSFQLCLRFLSYAHYIDNIEVGLHLACRAMKLK